MLGAAHPIQKGVIKKKVNNKGMSPLAGVNNGMLAAINPSGTIHVTGVGGAN